MSGSSPRPAVRSLATILAAALAGAFSGCAPAPPRIVDRVDVLAGQPLREPMLVEHPSGVLFAAGYSRDESEAQDPPNLFRSDDGGATWTQVDVGTAEEGALGNSDVDLAVGPDGALYLLTMGFDRRTGEGTHVSVGVTRDVGMSWTWHLLSRTRYDDRPWIAVAESGRVHVVWNDGSGVRHSVSEDAGGSWEEWPRIHDRGGSSHLAAGPGGRVAVRITPISASGNMVDEGVDLVAVSSDDGVTWELLEAPGDRVWFGEVQTAADIPRWVEPLAWGPNGELYALWSEESGLWLGRSQDLGATWDRWRLAKDEPPLYYPLLDVEPGGMLAASWFSGVGDDLRAHVGIIRPGGFRPSMGASEPIPVDAWEMILGASTRSPAGEYFPVAFLADGDLGAVLPIQGSDRGEGFSWLRLSW